MLAIPKRLVTVSRESIDCTLEATVFREIRYLIPFYMFLISFQFFLKPNVIQGLDSRCCNNENPGCTCKNVIVFDESIYEKNYVVEHQLLDKHGKNSCWSKNVHPETENICNLLQRQTSHRKWSWRYTIFYISTLKLTPGKLKTWGREIVTGLAFSCIFVLILPLDA